MRGFISPDRFQTTLLPASVDEYLPLRHLSRFVIEIVEQLDFEHVYRKYGRSGSTPYDPKMLLAMLFYGYATGTFSSRKLEAATFDSLPMRFICGNLHPDHDTINAFRKNFLKEIEVFFVDILVIAKQMGILKVGNVNIDGTKIQADASKHSAMSHEYMEMLEKRLKGEVERLMRLAEEADEKDAVELDIPEELERREYRMALLREAKKELKERAKLRYEKEKAEHDDKLKAREEKERETGKKPRSKEPKAPSEQVLPGDQYNFTDPESRIMHTPDGFEQCYNAQAAVTDNMLIVAAYANNHCNDRQEFLPMLESIDVEKLGKVETATADTGYFSAVNVERAVKIEIEPFIAVGRQPHNQWLDQKLAKETTPASAKNGTEKERMAQKLQTPAGKETYGKRKMTVEPVFGIIKEIMGFRQFSLRGEKAVHGEWMLVCASYNLKRLFNLANS